MTHLHLCVMKIQFCFVFLCPDKFCLPCVRARASSSSSAQCSILAAWECEEAEQEQWCYPFRPEPHGGTVAEEIPATGHELARACPRDLLRQLTVSKLTLLSVPSPAGGVKEQAWQPGGAQPSAALQLHVGCLFKAAESEKSVLFWTTSVLFWNI